MSNWLDESYGWIERICEASLDERAQDLFADPLKYGEMGIVGDIASFLSGSHAYLADCTGDSAHVERAADYLRMPIPVQAFSASAAWRGTLAARSAGRLSPEDDARLCEVMTNTAKGGVRGHFDRLPGFRIFNHAVTTANLCDVVSRLWPDARDAIPLREGAEEVWREWWAFGENIEGAPNYEAFAQVHVLQWAKRRGELDMALGHPATRYWMERGVEHILPLGFIPAFGDSHAAELWPDWFGLFSMIAGWTDGDLAGRAVQSAERLFRWVEARDWLEENIATVFGRIDNPMLFRLGWWHIAWTAFYFAMGREALLGRPEPAEPKPAPVAPIVTHRTLPAHDLIREESWSLVPPYPGPRTPEKAVLRLGTKPESPAAMLGCSRQHWHDHMDTGSVTSFAADGTLLLVDNGYMQKLPIDHNLFLAARTDEEWLAYSPDDWPNNRAKVGSWGGFDFQVRLLTGARVAQAVTAECNAPFWMPMYHERTVMLGRAGVMVVYDRVHPFADALHGSPIWHTGRVLRTGPGWAETRVDTMPGCSGLTMSNAEGNLLIVNPLDAAEWQVKDQEKIDLVVRPDAAEPAKSMTPILAAAHVTRLCLSNPVPLVAGEFNRLVTVLMPASRAPDPSDAVSVLHSEDGEYVMAAPGCLIVINDSRDVVSGPWGSTDAKFLFADDSGVFAHRVRSIRLPDVSLESDTMGVDVDLIHDGLGLRGAVSSEKSSGIRIVAGSREHEFVARGITPVNVVA